MRRWMNIAVLTMLLIELGSGSSGENLPTVPKWKPTSNDRTGLTPHRPTECRHLYNVGKHKEWSECMGVGYKPRRDM